MEGKDYVLWTELLTWGFGKVEHSGAGSFGMRGREPPGAALSAARLSKQGCAGLPDHCCLNNSAILALRPSWQAKWNPFNATETSLLKSPNELHVLHVPVVAIYSYQWELSIWRIALQPSSSLYLWSFQGYLHWVWGLKSGYECYGMTCVHKQKHLTLWKWLGF